MNATSFARLDRDQRDYPQGMTLNSKICTLMRSPVVEKKGLNLFLRVHRQDLATIAIKTPAVWIEFSQSMRSHFKKGSKLYKLLIKLDSITTLNFKHLYPSAVRQNIARLYPSDPYDNVQSLVAIKQLLIGDLRSLKVVTKIRDIPLTDLVEWIDYHRVPLSTLMLDITELKQVVPKLRFVDLSWYPKEIIPFMLALMSKVSHLTCIWLTDEDLDKLTALPYLTSLDLTGSAVTDKGIKNICQLNNLTRLNVSGCANLTDHSLQSLGSTETMIDLNISGCVKITYVGLKHLIKCKELKTLNVSTCNFGLVELQVIGLITSLKYLNLGGVEEFDGVSLMSLEKLIHLEEINLSFLKIDDYGVIYLTAFEKLKIVNLTGVQNITSKAIQSLCTQSIESLKIKGCSHISNAAFQNPLNMGKTLKVLDISGCYKISDEGLEWITEFKEITHLTLRGCNNVTSSGVHNLSWLPKLTYLNLQLCLRVTEIVHDYFTNVEIIM